MRKEGKRVILFFIYFFQKVHYGDDSSIINLDFIHPVFTAPVFASAQNIDFNLPHLEPPSAQLLDNVFHVGDIVLLHRLRMNLSVYRSGPFSIQLRVRYD